MHSSSIRFHFRAMKILHKDREHIYWNKSRKELKCGASHVMPVQLVWNQRNEVENVIYAMRALLEQIILYILGSLPQSTNGCKYILLVMDCDMENKMASRIMNTWSRNYNNSSSFSAAIGVWILYISVDSHRPKN